MVAYRKVKNGASSEYLVIAYFLSQGFDVFKACNPDSSFDLVAYQDNELFKIEVKTLTLHTTEQGTQTLGFPTPTNRNWDIFAIVDYVDNKIFTYLNNASFDLIAIRNELRILYFGPDRGLAETICGKLVKDETRHYIKCIECQKIYNLDRQEVVE